ncbi:MAG TPA: hypothetical protein VIF82_05505 [Burkholderiaceae bacterium]|jgi:hypothetical protein
MDPKTTHKLIALFLLLAIGGCANVAPSSNVTDTPTKGASFLYGRFSMDNKDAPLLLDGYLTIGFRIDCVDGQTYTIQFSNESNLQLIKIAPSKCSFIQIVYTNSHGTIGDRRSAPASALKMEKFEAGRGYYLGDYYATSWRDREMPRNITKLSWRITSAKNEYNATTDEMKKLYVNFANIPTEGKLLFRELDLSNAPISNSPASIQETDLQCFVKCKNAGGNQMA